MRLSTRIRVITTMFLMCLTLCVSLVAFTGTASAHTFAPVTTRVEVADQARLELYSPPENGLGVQASYKCSGTGTITISVTQTPSQSGSGVGDSATGSSPVRCDNKQHNVVVTMLGAGTFNVGTGTATATLTATSGTATDTETIHIHN